MARDCRQGQGQSQGRKREKETTRDRSATLQLWVVSTRVQILKHNLHVKGLDEDE